MERIELPNARELFIPDPGHTIVDADLQGADAQVVAWEAGDEDLKAAFRAGLKIHAHNAEAMWGSRYTQAEGTTDSGAKGKLYKDIKQGVHLTNYGGAARTLAVVLGWTVKEAEAFQQRWFDIHPGIRAWHRRTERSIAETGTVANRFGFVKTFFDRPDQNFTLALAWVPQSTVAINCFKGILAARRQYPFIKWLIQVHDSAVFSVPYEHEEDLPAILDTMHIPVPYDNPLIIPWDMKKSRKSWGEVE